MRLISKKSVLRILQEEPSYYDTQNAITEIYDKINELPTIEERKTVTHEEAVGFLQESGWLQDHDRQIYEQGYKNGKKEFLKKVRVVCRGKENPLVGYFDESRQLLFTSYVTAELLRRLGYETMSTIEEGAE